MSKHWSDYANTEEDGSIIMRLTAENEKLKRIVEVYEKANEFYADTKSWGELELNTDEYWDDYESLNPEKPRLMTGGCRARQAKALVERIRGEGK